MNLIRLRSLIFGTPIAIHPQKLEVILQALGSRIGLDRKFSEDIEAIQGFKQPGQSKNYSITKEGIAIVPVEGTLLKKAYGMDAMSGLTSYESLTAQLEDCYTSPQVKGILLDIDSPGGACNGLFELCDFIYSMRGDKPVYAVSNDSAFSAAYAIASCADRVFVTRTGGVGSIGVFCLHVDQSKADDKAGLKFTYIKAGAKKTEGNPHEPLSESALIDSQTEVDREYLMFTTLVSRNRGVSIPSITKTEAGCYFAEQAIPMLADEVGTFDDALSALTELVTGGQDTTVLNNSANRTREATQLMKTTKATADELALTALKAESDEMKKSDDEMESAKEDDECTKADVDPKDDEDDEDGEDDEDKKDEAKSASIIRILNLCTLAGQSELAASFITKGLSVEQVTKALLEQRASKSKATKVTNTVTHGTSIDRLKADSTKTTAKEYAQFLKTNSATYAKYLTERGN